MVRCIAIFKSAAAKSFAKSFKPLVYFGSVAVVMSAGVEAFGSSSMSAAASLSSPASAAINKAINKQSAPAADTTTPDRPSQRVIDQVRRELARQLGISPQQLSVVSYSRQTWSDSCLGLGTAVESCAQALVPGWQIELTDGEQTWTYRTDETAQTMRLQESSAQENAASVPEAVADRILELAAEASDIPQSELTLTEAQERTWDGCLGIVTADSFCTKIALPGWQAIVTAERDDAASGSWVYHSDAEGTDIRLNETASLPNSTVIPSFIPTDQLPDYEGNGVVFQAIVEGGITGSSNQILLLEDGQVVQFADDQGVSTATELNRLSPEQVQAFVELLQQQSFSNLHSLNYSAPTGAADHRTITLTSQGSTTRYADIVQDQLPSALQQVIQAWEQLISAED